MADDRLKPGDDLNALRNPAKLVGVYKLRQFANQQGVEMWGGFPDAESQRLALQFSQAAEQDAAVAKGLTVVVDRRERARRRAVTRQTT